MKMPEKAKKKFSACFARGNNQDPFELHHPTYPVTARRIWTRANETIKYVRISESDHCYGIAHRSKETLKQLGQLPLFPGPGRPAWRAAERSAAGENFQAPGENPGARKPPQDKDYAHCFSNEFPATSESSILTEPSEPSPLRLLCLPTQPAQTQSSMRDRPKAKQVQRHSI